MGLKVHMHRLTHMHYCSLVPGGRKSPLRMCVGLTCARLTQWRPFRMRFFRETRENNLIPYLAAVPLGSPLSSGLDVIIRVHVCSSLAECESDLPSSAVVFFRLFQNVLEPCLSSLVCGWEVACGEAPSQELKQPASLMRTPLL